MFDARRKTRFVLASALVAFAAACAAGVAAADPAEQYLHNLAAPPLCPQDVPDSSLPVCQVRFFGESWQALTSQSIILRIGEIEATQADCAAFSDATTMTFAIDGAPVPVTQIPCRYVARPIDNLGTGWAGDWGTDFRYLSEPGALAAGQHIEVATLTFNSSYSYSLGCTDPSGRCTVPAGTVNNYTSEITVSG
jgi:hypothetical protein